MLVSDQEWFLDFLKEAEGAGGFDGALFHPYDSPEGGEKTVGYGHKLNDPVVVIDGEEIDLRTTPLTKEQAEKLLAQDVKLAELKARQEYTQAGNPAGAEWEQLPPSYRAILTDIAFNVGTLMDKEGGGFGWPKLAEAMKKGDPNGIAKEASRTFVDPKTGERKPLKGRNTLVAKRLVPKVKEDVKNPLFNEDLLGNTAGGVLARALLKVARRREVQKDMSRLLGDLDLSARMKKQSELVKDVLDKTSPPSDLPKEQKEFQLKPGVFKRGDGKVFEVIEVK